MSYSRDFDFEEKTYSPEQKILLKHEQDSHDGQAGLESLCDPGSTMIQSSRVRLEAKRLFIVHAQQGVDRAIQEKQDLVEWFENVLKRLESCPTLQSLLTCFDNEMSDFPALSAFLATLEKNSSKVLEGIDGFQLLEQLKQIATETLSGEISWRFAVSRAENAKILRLKEEEKAKVEEKCRALMGEAGVSSSNSSLEAEMATASWQYMMHNLPGLFDDIKYVKNNDNELTESEWVKQFSVLLDQPASVFSKLPDHVKKGLKTYLKSYRKNTDYSEYMTLRNSLVGKPAISRMKREGKNILQIKGGHLLLSAVLAELNLSGIDEIQILATGTLFADASMDDAHCRGMNIVMTAKKMEVVTPVTLNTSGRDARSHASHKARDGESFSYTSSGSGYNGEDGLPGDPGQSAGHIHIEAGEIKGAENLHFIAHGGKGADGQDGGKGDKGQRGQNGRNANFYYDGWAHHATNQYHINQGTNGVLGQSGGNGGNGGGAGQGGQAGQVVVRDSKKDYVKDKIVNISADRGQDGIPGEPGQGADAGLDGLRGLDAGVAYTGGFTFQKDQELSGWDVYAWMKRGGWFTKDVWRLAAAVSEWVVKNTTRTRTQTRGRVGIRNNYKNSAESKTGINFSAILQQCPAVAGLSIRATDRASVAHDAQSRKLDAIFVLGNQREALENDIKLVEKKQQLLSDNLKKLEETSQSVFNHAVHQRVAQNQHVTQLADVSLRPVEDEKSAMPAVSAFVLPMNESEAESEPESERPGRDDQVAHRVLHEIVAKALYEAEEKEEGGLIFAWQEAVGRLQYRLKSDLQKVVVFCPRLTVEEVYASLEKMSNELCQHRSLCPEDLTGRLYETSLWYACDPEFVEKALKSRQDPFQCLMQSPVTEDRLKLILSFMRLTPANLDELRHGQEENATLFDQYYHQYFYKPLKEVILSKRALLTAHARQLVRQILDNLFLEAKNAGDGIGYSESVKILNFLVREMDTLKNEPHKLQCRIGEYIDLFRTADQDDQYDLSSDEENEEEDREDNEEKEEINISGLPAANEQRANLSDIPFPSRMYAAEDERYQQAKKELSDFIESHQHDPVWRSIFERIQTKLISVPVDRLPVLEEVSVLFSTMTLREKPETLVSDLHEEEISNWGNAVLTNNVMEKLRQFVNIQSSGDSTEWLDTLGQKIDLLSDQPVIMEMIYHKLASEVSLFEPKLAVSLNELQEIFSGFTNPEKGGKDSDFIAALQETPLSGWERVLREHYLHLSLPVNPSPDRKRCILLIARLEESLGRRRMNILVESIQKADKSSPVNYAQLADMLVQLRYQQLTLDDDSLLLLEQAEQEQWRNVLEDYHRKETQKTRDVQVLLRSMQNEETNKNMEMLFSRNGNPPLVLEQINAIHAHLSGTSHRLASLLTGVEEKAEIEEKNEKKTTLFSHKPINTWTREDIPVWSNAFRQQADGRTLVAENLSEIIAVISQAIFLEKGFYPRDVQYLALLTAFDGSNHAQKIISQIATGQGKTMTCTMLALLKVLAGDRVDFVTSSDVLARETSEETRSICKMFAVTAGSNCEVLDPSEERSKLQESYRSDILCGDLQSFMRAHLLTEFYGQNITQNRNAFMMMDEVDRLLDEMQDILYLSHDIPDMHHMDNLLVNIWEAVNYPGCAEETQENIAGLTKHFIDKLAPGYCSARDVLDGKILIPEHLDKFVRRRLSTWIRSAYIAKNGLSMNGEYIVAQMGEGEQTGVYLVDRDTGVTSRNKELAHGVHQFLRLKHQEWPKSLSLKAIYCDPVSFLLEQYKNGFAGVTGTLGSAQDCNSFKKMFDIQRQCVVPRHELLKLKVDAPILVSSFQEQMEATARIVQECLALRQPVAIFCDTIEDVNVLTQFLMKEKGVPEESLFPRIHSFESFTKGSEQDPVKPGDVIITTALSGRGTDLKLTHEAEQVGLCLIKLSVGQNERADNQEDGRTARKGLPGRLTHVLRPMHGESSIEEMQAKRDLYQERLRDRVKKEDLHQNRINRQLFDAFRQLVKEVEAILRKTEPGNGSWAEGYIERQMAALRTHWGLWLDEVEQTMDETGIRNADTFHREFQTFRGTMLARAAEEGPVKLVTGAGEITRLGVYFGIKNNSSDFALQCFDKVIKDYYSFSGQALYYKAFVMLKSAAADDLYARKKAVYYLKRARALLRKELQRLQEPVDRMVSINKSLREKGLGLHDSQFKKTVNGRAQSLMIHLGAIDLLMGAVTDPSFFLSDTDNKAEAEERFNRLVGNGKIKGYRVSKKVSFTSEGADRQLEYQFIDGRKRQIEFPSELEPFREKIINVIAVRQKGDLNFRTLSYENYCTLVFRKKEADADEVTLQAMKLSWSFLQEEGIIKQPGLRHSRTAKMSLEKDKRPSGFSETGWMRSGGLLRVLDEIEVYTEELQNLSERGQIPMDVLSFFRHFLEFDNVIRIEKKPVHWSWGATLVLFWAVAQITAGILLGIPELVEQGVGDLVFLTMSAIRGDFSMENYLRHKRIAVSMAALSGVAKVFLDKIIVAADKYVMAQRASQTLDAVNTGIRLPEMLLDSLKKVSGSPGGSATSSGLSFTEQFGNAMGQVAKAVAKQSTMMLALAAVSKESMADKVHQQMKASVGNRLSSRQHDLKQYCLEILRSSESCDQAKRIILAVFRNTLEEHQPQRFSIKEIALSDNMIGQISGSIVSSWTGNEILGNLTSAVMNAGMLDSAEKRCQTLLEEVRTNLSAKVASLKQKMPEAHSFNITETEQNDFDSFIDRELAALDSGIYQKSFQEFSGGLIRSAVDFVYDQGLSGIQDQLSNISASLASSVDSKTSTQLAESVMGSLLKSMGQKTFGESPLFPLYSTLVDSVSKNGFSELSNPDAKALQSVVQQFTGSMFRSAGKELFGDSMFFDLYSKSLDYLQGSHFSVSAEKTSEFIRELGSCVAGFAGEKLFGDSPVVHALYQGVVGEMMNSHSSGSGGISGEQMEKCLQHLAGSLLRTAGSELAGGDSLFSTLTSKTADFLEKTGFSVSREQAGQFANEMGRVLTNALSEKLCQDSPLLRETMDKIMEMGFSGEGPFISGEKFEEYLRHATASLLSAGKTLIANDPMSSELYSKIAGFLEESGFSITDGDAGALIHGMGTVLVDSFVENLCPEASLLRDLYQGTNMDVMARGVSANWQEISGESMQSCFQEAGRELVQSALKEMVGGDSAFAGIVSSAVGYIQKNSMSDILETGSSLIQEKVHACLREAGETFVDSVGRSLFGNSSLFEHFQEEVQSLRESGISAELTVVPEASLVHSVRQYGISLVGEACRRTMGETAFDLYSHVIKETGLYEMAEGMSQAGSASMQDRILDACIRLPGLAPESSSGENHGSIETLFSAMSEDQKRHGMKQIAAFLLQTAGKTIVPDFAVFSLCMNTLLEYEKMAELAEKGTSRTGRYTFFHSGCRKNPIPKDETTMLTYPCMLRA